MAISVVATTLKDARDSSPSANTYRYSITLTNGSGSDRAVFVFASGRRGAARTLSTATLDSTASTDITNLSVDGGQACSSAMIAFKDSELPSSSGTYDLDLAWSNSLLADPVVVIEMTGVDQATLWQTFTSNTATSVADLATISATLSGESGQFVFSYLAMADASAFGTPANVAPASTTSLGTAGGNGTTNAESALMSVAYDTSAATASEAYQWTVDPDGTAPTDSVVTAVFAVNAASGGGGAIEVSADSSTTTSLAENPALSLTASVNLSPASAKAASVSVDPSVSVTANVVVLPASQRTTSSSLSPSVFLTAEVAISAQSPKSLANSSDPSVSLGSSVDVSAQSPTTTSTALEPDIQLSSGVSVSAQAPRSASVSSDPDISLTAVVDVSAQSPKTTSAAQSPAIALSVPLIIQAQSPKTTSAANDPIIGLAGAVNVVALFGRTASNAPRPAILVGTATRIDDFTINYRESDVSGSYQSGIETSYSDNVLTANYRG